MAIFIPRNNPVISDKDPGRPGWQSLIVIKNAQMWSVTELHSLTFDRCIY